MARAYDVMSMAKRQGAEVNAVQKYDDYMKRVRAEEARASKAGMLGKIGGGIGGSIASYLAPALITAAGIGTGGIGSLLLSGVLGAGISRGGTEIGDLLARQWSMGGKRRGKEFDSGDIGKMEGISGAYGQRYASKLGRAGREEMQGYQKTISEMLDVENMNRWLSSGMSGLSAAGKARSGAEALKGMPDASIGERMKAGLQGDIGSGYKLGAKDTGDFWKFGGLNQRTMNPLELAETNPYNIMEIFSKSDDWTGYKPNLPYRPSYYESEPSLLDEILAQSKRRRI